MHALKDRRVKVEANVVLGMVWLGRRALCELSVGVVRGEFGGVAEGHWKTQNSGRWTGREQSGEISKRWDSFKWFERTRELRVPTLVTF